LSGYHSNPGTVTTHTHVCVCVWFVLCNPFCLSIHRVTWFLKDWLLCLQCQQHVVFPAGNPSNYWPHSKLLNFGCWLFYVILEFFFCFFPPFCEVFFTCIIFEENLGVLDHVCCMLTWTWVLCCMCNRAWVGGLVGCSCYFWWYIKHFLIIFCHIIYVLQ
jgi:hypothetical protein